MTKSTTRYGVLLSNLGTPDSPETADVRRYLREFLWDPRVIKVWRPLWWCILNFIILTTRPKKSARAYKKVWTDEGSPLLSISLKQLEAVRLTLPDIPVELGMRYGSPATKKALDRLREQGVTHFIVLSLYPQFSYTTVASVEDEVSRVLKLWKDPEIGYTMIQDYHDFPDYIDALADSVRHYRNAHGDADKLLMSFHGIPQEYADDGDPYPAQCEATAQKLADKLGLKSEQWQLTFQSRLGPRQWLTPYTDKTLEQWGKEGIKSVQVICPGFSVDCLETLEEVAMENSEIFLEAGGEKYQYISCLNESSPHISMIVKLLRQYIKSNANQHKK